RASRVSRPDGLTAGRRLAQRDGFKAVVGIGEVFDVVGVGPTSVGVDALAENTPKASVNQSAIPRFGGDRSQASKLSPHLGLRECAPSTEDALTVRDSSAVAVRDSSDFSSRFAESVAG